MIVGNKANSGGALYIRENSIAVVSDCGLDNNSAETIGGAIELYVSCTLSVSNSTLESINQLLKSVIESDL